MNKNNKNSQYVGNLFKEDSQSRTDKMMIEILIKKIQKKFTEPNNVKKAALIIEQMIHSKK